MARGSVTWVITGVVRGEKFAHKAGSGTDRFITENSFIFPATLRGLLFAI